MPSTVVHSFFAKDVYDILPTEISQKLDLCRCKMFSQGTDSLMFYNLFSIMPGKKIRTFNTYFHTHQTQEFFLNLLQTMRDHKREDPDTYSFLVGFICHFILDATVHPYIIYKTGVFRKKKPNTYKYNNAHSFMETFLDNDMIRRRAKQNPYQFDITRFCFDLRSFSPSLIQTIDETFNHTFHLQNMSPIYYKSLKQMKAAIDVFRKDPHGVKKEIYKIIDTFTPRNCFRFEAVSYHYPLEDRHHYLNNNHSLWRYPTSYDITSTESFVDLYLKAIKQAKVTICASFDYLNGKNIDLKQIFPDISYITGIDCSVKKELKYFEF